MNKEFRYIGIFLLFSVVFLINSTASAQPALTGISQRGDQQLVLKLTHATEYKIFHLKDPARLFVYIYGSRINEQQMENKGVGNYVKYWKIYPFAGTHGTVRVEIGIAENLEYRDWTVDNEIFIWMGTAEQTPPPHPSSVKKTPPPIMEVGDYSNAHPEIVGPEPPPPRPSEITGQTAMLSTKYMDRPSSSPRATKFLDIVVTAGNDAARIVVNTNGPVRSFDDFTLKGPRLVLDFFETKADFTSNKLEIQSGSITAVRWGPHKDRMRIVFDLAPSYTSWPYYKVTKLRSGVEIAIYPNRHIAQTPESEYKIYTVVQGENLSDIARKKYADKRAWRRIVTFNREKFADSTAVMDSNGFLYPRADTTLKIPIR